MGKIFDVSSGGVDSFLRDMMNVYVKGQHLGRYIGQRRSKEQFGVKSWFLKQWEQGRGTGGPQKSAPFLKGVFLEGKLFFEFEVRS